LLIAPAKVLQGAVRLHGLTSSPTPETQVRVACAEAEATPRTLRKRTRSNLEVNGIDPLGIALSR
jgi:hypothetical protein